MKLVYEVNGSDAPPSKERKGLILTTSGCSLDEIKDLAKGLAKEHRVGIAAVTLRFVEG